MVVCNRANFTAPTQAELKAANDTQNALLPIQQVPVEGSSKSCNVFFDSGSNTTLVRHAYAQELGLPGSPVTQHLQVTGKKPEQWDTIAYRVPLCKTNGEIEYVLAFRIKDITADLPPVNFSMESISRISSDQPALCICCWVYRKEGYFLTMFSSPMKTSCSANLLLHLDFSS